MCVLEIREGLDRRTGHVCIRDWGRFRQENRDMRGLENRDCVEEKSICLD